jgi:hypothetical protein
MAGTYWIKLYEEILDDSKMAVLPDRLWRRVIELFLLAGRYYKDGQLPDTNELCWALRMPMEELDLDIKQIAQTGIIKKNERGWLVVNFKKRQVKMTPAEKMRLYRERLQQDQYYGDDNDNVTLSNTDALQEVTQITDNRIQITDTDNRSDIDKNDFPKIEINKPPALQQAWNEWHKQEVIAIGRNRSDLIETYQPPPDADWKIVDEKTHCLKFELRKVNP